MHRWTGLLITVVSLLMMASASGGQNETTDTMPSKVPDWVKKGMMSESVSPEQLHLRAREIRVLEQLGNAATAWLKTADQSSRRQVDTLIDELLGQAKPGVKAYFAAAKVADLCGDTDKAIAILQDVIAKHGTENALGFAEPVNVVAYHWIGRLARDAGDAETAMLAYQTAEANSSKLESKDTHVVTCKVYMAEIASADTKEARAKKRLDELEGKLKTVEQGSTKVPGWGVIRDWAQYRHATMKGDKNKARQLLQGSSDYNQTTLFMLAGLHLSLSGVAGQTDPALGRGGPDNEEFLAMAGIRRLLEDGRGRSQTDKHLARFLAANVCEIGRIKDLAGAEKHYSALFETESFFSPVAGIGLARCKKARGQKDKADAILDQVKARYPGCDALVTEARKSSK